jgi:hypothetical protein
MLKSWHSGLPGTPSGFFCTAPARNYRNAATSMSDMGFDVAAMWRMKLGDATHWRTLRGGHVAALWRFIRNAKIHAGHGFRGNVALWR